ncbi:hypothetical protein [Heyndrickxia acidicola]|uniref:Uncharacterized protein n=1 Tax=Heyndrickxia acidicola TaxID=209389 RepID=A0ABU6MG11_9BACI|nr:hypothetical protein [Heyndrickxia acidicola]MED1203349.1 hypothetical protein [Heyndrickxia acidicola]
MLKKHFIIATLLVLALSFTYFPKYSAADTAPASTDGFIIEADAVEGVMGIPELVSGETSSSSNQLMLRIHYTHARIIGLKLTKVLNTPSGPVTIQMKASQPVELNQMSVDATKLEFGGIYVPKVGEIGMKNVRLVAHKQTADTADLNGLNVSFVSNASADTTADSDDALKSLADKLTQLVSGNGLTPGADSQQLIDKLLKGAVQQKNTSTGSKTNTNGTQPKPQANTNATASSVDENKSKTAKVNSNTKYSQEDSSNNKQIDQQCKTNQPSQPTEKDKTKKQHGKNSTDSKSNHVLTSSQSCQQGQKNNTDKDHSPGDNQKNVNSSGTSNGSDSSPSSGTNAKANPPGTADTGTSAGASSGSSSSNPAGGSSSNQSGSSSSSQSSSGGLFGFLNSLLP